MGMIVYVYRDADGSDCTAGGISSKFNKLTIINVDGPFDPTPDAPAVVLENGPLNSMRIVPVFKPEGAVGPMFGGNYAASSDSRVRDAIGFYGAVAIHDRFESPEMYNLLSN
jgi:hypothetical protein